MPEIDTNSGNNLSTNTQNVASLNSDRVSDNLTDNHQDNATTSVVQDPNKIKVNLVNEKRPVVVLFGPPSSGKTMMLIRLARYLRRIGYKVEPNRGFRPGDDESYKKMCDEFNYMINNEQAASSTSILSFMLAEIRLNGTLVCQVLEAPGEHYFRPKEGVTNGFPPYINTIINSECRKIWLLMFEPDTINSVMNNPQTKLDYVDTIVKGPLNLKRNKNGYIIVLNKVDQTGFINEGKFNKKSAISDIKDNFPGLFDALRNKHPISKLWRPYDCGFVEFMSGNFTKANDGTVTYVQSGDKYPKALWYEIMKQIRG